MKTFICEICGDAYLGKEKPKNCPFCGAGDNFIKDGALAKPLFKREGKIGEKSKINLLKTLDLEMHANVLYLCMGKSAKTYEIEAMYKRLAKVELEHASVVCKFLGIKKPDFESVECSREDVENFKKTIELEEKASHLYRQFAKDAEEERIKLFFAGLAIAEDDHIDLIKNYL